MPSLHLSKNLHRLSGHRLNKSYVSPDPGLKPWGSAALRLPRPRPRPSPNPWGGGWKANPAEGYGGVEGVEGGVHRELVLLRQSRMLEKVWECGRRVRRGCGGGRRP